MPKHASSAWHRLGFSFNSGSFCVVVAFGSSPAGGPWVITLQSISADWPSSGTSPVDREDGVFVCESGGVGSASYSCTLRRFRGRGESWLMTAAAAAQAGVQTIQKVGKTHEQAWELTRWIGIEPSFISRSIRRLSNVLLSLNRQCFTSGAVRAVCLVKRLATIIT